MQGHDAIDDGVAALIVPGIGNSGPDHWQSLWEQRHPRWQRVEQRDWDRPVCEEWLRGLDAALARLSVPPVLVAHSMGCLLVVHWAQRSKVPVRAAFLVAPPDPEGPAFPPVTQGFETVPTDSLPFPSLVVASSDDPFGSVAYAKRCAENWGSTFVAVGAVGHINAESDLGDWPAGLALLDGLLKSS
ncbi:MAG: alpha/beta hydrolase [Nitrospira sp.]|nr:alpha/beta hydrolase [Nitrospira sp.]